MAGFPVDELRPTNATITAVLATPTPRLTFRIRVEFALFEFAHVEIDASLLWDSVQVPGLRHWHELANRRISGGDEVMEGAFCVHQWSPVENSLIRLGARNGATFPLEARAVVDFAGYRFLAADHALAVRARTDAVFTGLELHGSTMQPPPTTPEAARQIAEAHLDLAGLGEPSRRGPSFFFPALIE